MNYYFMLCVTFGVIISLHASAQEKLENLPSEAFPIRYLYNKTHSQEGQLKRLEEKVDKMKKMIEERDDMVNLLQGQVKNLSNRLKNFQGHSAIETAFIVTETRTLWVKGVIKFEKKIIDPTNSFNVEEGIFQVPTSGNYLFFFQSSAFKTGRSWVNVYVNGSQKYSFRETSGVGSYNKHQHNLMFTIKLEKADKLWLYNIYHETLRSDKLHPMTFVGYKTD